MKFNFIVDKTIKDKVYPALARWEANPYTPEWRQFLQHWPHTVPCQLIEHCKEYNVPYQLYSVTDEYPNNSYYPIGVGFFDFNIDYFGLMSENIQRALKLKKIIALFYYHEGDNPFNIKERLDALCSTWNLPVDCYRFVSGNTQAEKIPGFIYFPDHELLYWERNKNANATPIYTGIRSKDFTALCRTHKWWRATVVSDLHRNNLLSNSFWSYNTRVLINDRVDENPIEIDTINIRDYMSEFLSNGPYYCDNLTEQQHNDHSIVDPLYFNDSYCNLVIETHFDADSSGGTFLTEKTFKPIKHGQPFIIIGPAGSLETLRNLGYKTFDHAIDNSYDTIINNTERWLAIVEILKKIKNSNMHEWFFSCYNDILHNQQLFLMTKANRLNNLLNKLQFP